MVGGEYSEYPRTWYFIDYQNNQHVFLSPLHVSGLIDSKRNLSSVHASISRRLGERFELELGCAIGPMYEEMQALSLFFTQIEFHGAIELLNFIKTGNISVLYETITQEEQFSLEKRMCPTQKRLSFYVSGEFQTDQFTDIVSGGVYLQYRAYAFTKSEYGEYRRVDHMKLGGDLLYLANYIEIIELNERYSIEGNAMGFRTYFQTMFKVIYNVRFEYGMIFTNVEPLSFYELTLGISLPLGQNKR